MTATRQGDGYVQTESSTATRTSASIFETPASVQVVSEQVAQDQGVWRLKDVYRNVSGVQPFKTEGFAVTFESAFLRGFHQNPYVNGTRTFGLGPVDLAGIERVEILKGPASLLYGAIEPGGVLNLVPKTPLFSPRYKASLQAGSYDFYRGSFDVTGPLDEEREMAFRVAGAYQNSGSFRDSLTDESVFLTPSFAWHPSDDTRVTAWLWYQHLDKPVDDGVAFSNAGQPIAPIETFLGDPNHNTQEIDDVFGGVTLEHEFSHTLSFRQEVQAHLFDAEMDAVRRFGGTSPTNTVSPFYDASQFDQWDINSRSELLFTPETESVKHEVLLGLQVFRRQYEFRRRRDTTSVPPISIVNPNFPNLNYTINNTGRSDEDLTFVSLYLQDHMRLLEDRLHVLGGLRVDHARQDNNSQGQEDVALTWRAGLLYKVTPWLAPYANVSTSFNPTRPNLMTAAGSELDPETGIQYEAGAKFSFLEEQLQMTIAGYQIDKEDVAIADPADPSFRVNGGELRSRGFEFDVSGRIAPGLDVIGSYAYTDTEVVRSSALPVGARFRGIPLHSASLWVKYSFEEASALEGFGLGAGVFGSSSKPGDDANTFDLDGFTRLDMAAWYDLNLEGGRNVRFHLNAFNVTDEEYYESSFNIARVQPGSPFTVFGGMSVTF